MSGRSYGVEMALQALERAQEREHRVAYSGSLTAQRHAREAREEAQKRYIEALNRAATQPTVPETGRGR